MKTNPAARRHLRIRWLTLCALVLAVAGLELGLGRTFFGALGLNAGCTSDLPAGPAVTMADFTSAAAAVR